MGLMVISLFVLAACSSTSDTEGDMSGSEGSSSSANSSGSSARSSAGSNSGQLSQEEIRAQNALRQTVFYFDFDIAEFKTEDRNTLTFHARDLASSPSKRIRLEGHADERGTREYNLALAERRANGILNYLIVNGASRSQIEVVSYGEERPAQSGSSENAYSRNRRVEIVGR
ncbi:MAG: peptidoglycan-associated lipoprotein Pal [Gammaproteobacteria bacterium]|nr:peptidoglycan-associated lipoprotein Pal [Gammaproteobacteria bacterium]MBT3860395.1 peptidoglycan-associated lipoprotein Pal [Gammaproteobacteria bacterium]MBT3986010.1 peptidoglycan-associated lipoprotein Pal [Gammaproteobacteria bacterium]MBT4257467.1 peptidoglycan-associated lipoprotein Pal [Gammaproteobacteria bacterium]MBT4582372.1 peptidoglycan-associated lipoprotein Pal [Gammaproteobacteria bacterium]